MDIHIPEDMARAAAHWWAGQIDGTKRHNNGSSDVSSVLAGILADSMNTLEPEKSIRKFEDILTEKIKSGTYRPWNRFMVDYGPDPILRDAAKEAGVNAANLPWKTAMHLDTDFNRIEVSAGYGAGWETIWKGGK